MNFLTSQNWVEPLDYVLLLVMLNIESARSSGISVMVISPYERGSPKEIRTHRHWVQSSVSLTKLEDGAIRSVRLATRVVLVRLAVMYHCSTWLTYLKVRIYDQLSTLVLVYSYELMSRETRKSTQLETFNPPTSTSITVIGSLKFEIISLRKGTSFVPLGTTTLIFSIHESM